MNGEFEAALRDLMASWGWPPEQIEYALPVCIRACVGVGILQPVGDGYELTPLVQDDDAWERVWALLRKEGFRGHSA